MSGISLKYGNQTFQDIQAFVHLFRSILSAEADSYGGIQIFPFYMDGLKGTAGGGFIGCAGASGRHVNLFVLQPVQ